MDRRIVDRVESWESRPISDGFAGLQSLVDDDFSGAVSAAGAWLFLLNGRGVGVFEGSIDDFDGVTGTAYEAPDPALPLLFTMQEAGGETYATYYTNDTPLSEVDDTLTDASFTGYVELSENVLSGDYYVVYYGGRSMSAAFVGSSERLVSGDEAYEKACDEVGIYEVTKVDLDLVDIPDRSAGSADRPSATGDDLEDDGADHGVDTSADDSEGSFDEDPIESADPESTARDVAPVDEPTSSQGAGASASIEEAEPTTDPTQAGADADQGAAATDTGTPTDDETGSPVDAIESAEPDDAGQSTATNDDSTPPDPRQESSTGDAVVRTEPASQETAGEPETGGGTEPSPPDRPTDSSGGAAPQSSQEESTAPDRGSSGSESAEDPFSEEEQWRETRTIPALDPEESEKSRDAAQPSSEPGGHGEPGADVSADRAEPRPQQGSPGPAESAGSSPEASGQGASPANQELDRVKSTLAEREDELETLRQRHEEATARVETLEEERDELRARVEELETAVEGADTGEPDAGPSQSLDRETALEQTDLFVRYRSKGEGTLEKAHGGQASRDDLAGNLRLEHHTRFAEDDVAVEGRPFQAFLSDTIEYRFVEWLVEDLLWEIQGTGSRGKLKDLYDSLPEIDRAEFRGTVSIRDDEGEERRRTFDVVVRDRMGQPLVVANINDRRDPATGEMMESLVEASTEVAEALETLGAAFQVTASFFKPDALETAAQATGSGFLSRDKRESFVKIARKRGHHLCLAESRGDDFHVTVPEL